MKSVVVLFDPGERPTQPFASGLKKPFPGTLPAGGAESPRKKLWDLSPNLYCSIIGTCLTSDELRKIMQKCRGDEVRSLSDHDLHTEAVHTAAEKGDAGKLLNKALDRRHEAAIQRFDKAKSPAEILALWNEAKRRGDVAGAYWAGITHRKSDQEFIRVAFGDIHMLSHLVASTNRADIRRLSALEEEHAALLLKCDELQTRLNEAGLAREELLRELDAAAVAPAVRETDDSAEVANLRKLAAELQDKLSTEMARRERAEMRLAPVEFECNRMDTELRDAREKEHALQEELDAAEARLRVPASSPGGLPDGLRDGIILYVGGRAGQIQEIRAFVESAGGEFLHHDGGVEHRRGLLAGMVSRADAVFFPVDCISHDAMGNLKRLCSQAGKPFFPLRTTSVTSFNAGLKCFADPVQQS